MWQKYINLLFFFVIVINLFLATWYVLHGDILFSSDIARDFFLFEEIAQKHVMLLGPRSSTNGLFHGPLWAYLNFPAYYIGQGNPLIVGWYWVLLICGFLLSSFYVAKKLFNTTTAYIYTVLLSQLIVFHARGLFNPHGALFVLPLFFYFFIRYMQTQKIKFLLLHLFIAGLVIQFQMSVGAPLLLLSSLIICYRVFFTKKFLHILSFAILLVPLSTFILFDIKHDFLQLRSALGFISPATKSQSFNYFSQIPSRFNLLYTGLQLVRLDSGIPILFVGGIFVTVVTLAVLQIKQNKNKLIFTSLLYFYLGYILLSFLNKGELLIHQFFPLFSLTTLLFVSLANTKYRKVFYILFGIVFIYNTMAIRNYIEVSKSFIGKNPESWKGLSTVGQALFNNYDHSFGYFVYGPDTLAYGPKYATKYYQKQSAKQVTYLEKKLVTYLVVEPPPATDTFMTDDWWKENKLHSTKKPESIQKFPNGYQIERYRLTYSETQIPPSSDIDPGLHFR